MRLSNVGHACGLLLLLLVAVPLGAAEPTDLRGGLLFHASFDKSADADWAKGDRRVYTASSLKRESVRAGLPNRGVQWSQHGGRSGSGALHFTEKQDELVFYRGESNVPTTKGTFRGTVSLWLRLSPHQDLPKGYVDPLQITDKTWNDAAFFIDFDEAATRDFRLGVFSDFSFWNPSDRPFESIPAAERPMVFVTEPPFDRSRWTHVAFTWDDFQAAGQGRAILFMDGKMVGKIDRPQKFTWEPRNVAIMLGINFVGWIDDLRVYDRPLEPTEITSLVVDAAVSP